MKGKVFIYFTLALILLIIIFKIVYAPVSSQKISLHAEVEYREVESKAYSSLLPFSEEGKSDMYLIGINNSINGIIDFSVLPRMFVARINSDRSYDCCPAPGTLIMVYRCYLTRKGRTGVIDKVECDVRKIDLKDNAIIWQKSYDINENQTDRNQAKNILKRECVRLAREYISENKMPGSARK